MQGLGWSKSWGRQASGDGPRRREAWHSWAEGARLPGRLGWAPGLPGHYPQPGRGCSKDRRFPRNWAWGRSVRTGRRGLCCARGGLAAPSGSVPASIGGLSIQPSASPGHSPPIPYAEAGHRSETVRARVPPPARKFCWVPSPVLLCCRSSRFPFIHSLMFPLEGNPITMLSSAQATGG